MASQTSHSSIKIHNSVISNSYHNGLLLDIIGKLCAIRFVESRLGLKQCELGLRVVKILFISHIVGTWNDDVVVVDNLQDYLTI